MFKKKSLIIFGILTGLLIGFIVFVFIPSIKSQKEMLPFFQKKQVVGFLPYWLLDKAKVDYSKYINTLTYFGLSLDTDGKILKLSNPGETEPGWLALKTGRLDTFFTAAKDKKVALSLLVFSGNQDSINSLMDNPVENANNLVSDVAPIMKQYGFSNLNLDIEKTSEASEEARTHFTQFAAQVKSELEKQKLGTLTIDVSPSAFIKKYLINPQNVAEIADYFVVMAYDYHFANSYVTGPVAPLAGAGTISEYDTQAAIGEALKIISADKIILGVPLYGYEWETISNFPRAAIIPGTGLTISNNRAEQFLLGCATCSPQLDTTAQERYLIYKDEQTGTYHQFFYPDINATTAKINYSKKNNLGGIALWALGYEGSTIIDPLSKYK